MRIILEFETLAVCEPEERKVIEQFLLGQLSGIQAALLLGIPAQSWRERLAELIDGCVAKEGGRVVAEGHDGVRFADLRLYRAGGRQTRT